MPRPNGPQWVRLYRGLHATTPEHLQSANLRGIGSHWSASPDVAYNFATGRDLSGTFHYQDEDDVPASGTVVEALVHPRHIIDPNSDEGQEWQMGESVFGPEHSEQERTVRPDATVHVQSLHYFDDDKNEYKETKVPKEIKFRGRA